MTVSLGSGVNDDGGALDDNGTRRDDVKVDVENLVGGASNDGLTGSNASNLISGGGGNDAISGGVGNDTLNGDAGDDTLNGDAGNDTLVGGGGADTMNGGANTDLASYAGIAAPVTVIIDGNPNDGNAADDNGVRRDDVKPDVENLLGGSGADSLTGSDQANQLDGGPGADTLFGLDGNDTLLAFDGLADAFLNCDGGGLPGNADVADVDATDPPATGCETVTTH